MLWQKSYLNISKLYLFKLQVKRLYKIIMNTINAPALVLDKNFTNWNDWLNKTEEKLKKLGFRRFYNGSNHENFSYQKIVLLDEVEIYYISVLFYDFRDAYQPDSSYSRISIMYECGNLQDDRVNMKVSKNMSLSDFEKIAYDFYDLIIKPNFKFPQQ